MVSQSGWAGPPSDEPPEGVLEVVTRSPVPALILRLPSERIVAASPAARDLLSPVRNEVVGGDFESFTADAPTGALELLIAGRLNGYEGVRRFRLRDGATEPFHFWVRAIGDEIPQRFVLVTIMVDGRPAGSAPCPLPGAFNIVIGTADEDLRIERLSSDAGPILAVSRPSSSAGPSFGSCTGMTSPR
jgi:PAS domain-containing protein